jgi:predicted ribonuclease YlaK
VSNSTIFENPWPVVGRTEELETLKRALGDPDCGGVALVGGAGFGKTCLEAARIGGRSLNREYER